MLCDLRWSICLTTSPWACTREVRDTELEVRRQLETEASLLKTYLLEAHSENTGQRDILRLLQNGFWPGKVG